MMSVAPWLFLRPAFHRGLGIPGASAVSATLCISHDPTTIEILTSIYTILRCNKTDATDCARAKRARAPSVARIHGVQPYPAPPPEASDDQLKVVVELKFEDGANNFNTCAKNGSFAHECKASAAAAEPDTILPKKKGRAVRRAEQDSKQTTLAIRTPPPSERDCANCVERTGLGLRPPTPSPAGTVLRSGTPVPDARRSGSVRDRP